MNDYARLQDLLRSTLPAIDDRGPRHDLWPSIERRIETPLPWPRLDLILLAFFALLLVIFPDCLLLLALHF